jgi:hypothetical protein
MEVPTNLAESDARSGYGRRGFSGEAANGTLSKEINERATPNALTAQVPRK